MNSFRLCILMQYIYRPENALDKKEKTKTKRDVQKSKHLNGNVSDISTSKAIHSMELLTHGIFFF